MRRKRWLDRQRRENMFKCRVCGTEIDNYLFLFGEQPNAAQKLPSTKEEAWKAKEILDVRQCPRCGLIQLANDPVSYYKESIRASGSSPSLLRRQYNALAKFIFQFYLDQKRVVEIGSGNGEYLPLIAKLTDVEPMGISGYPEEDIIVPPAQPFDAFVCINYLEHLPDPNEFLKRASGLLMDNGVGMISVPDSEESLARSQMFTFMKDHLLYFTRNSFNTALSLNGLEVIDLFRNYDLGVLTAYVIKRPQLNIENLKNLYVKTGVNLEEVVDMVLNSGKKAAIWGASHFAFSLISALPSADQKISYIVDSSPLKQGKFSPGSGIEIFPPDHLLVDPVDTIIIASPEYAIEIRKTIEEKYPGHTIFNFLYGG